MCKYLDKWETDFRLKKKKKKKSRIGQSRALCKVCNADFSAAHGGQHNVRQHENSLQHKCALEAYKHAHLMAAFITRNVTEADQVTNAEVKMAMLCAMCHVPGICQRKKILSRKNQSNATHHR